MENNFNQLRGTASDPGVYGLIPAFIGIDIQVTLHKTFYMSSGRFLSAGQKCHVTVRDGTTVPGSHDARWICTHKSCVKKSWATRTEMMADHPTREELTAEFQAHLYCAYLHTDRVVGVDEVIDAKGKVITEAILARAGELIVMSDETCPADGYLPKVIPGPQLRPLSYFDGPMGSKPQR